MIKKAFLVLMSKGKVFTRDSKLFYLIPILVLILGDVFFFTISSDLRIFGIILIFIYTTRRYRLKSDATFLFALLLFLLTYIQYIFSDPALFHQPIVPTVEKTAVWLYLFLVIGVIQKWRE